MPRVKIGVPSEQLAMVYMKMRYPKLIGIGFIKL